MINWWQDEAFKNASWLKENPWMRYSTAKDAMFCAYCTIFEKRESKAKTFNLSSPVTDWSNLFHLVKRQLLEDSPHHDCIGQGQAFLEFTSLKSKSIASSLSSLHDETVAQKQTYPIKDNRCYCSFWESRFTTSRPH